MLRTGYRSKQVNMTKHDNSKAKANRWWCPDCKVSRDRSHTYCGGCNGTKADLTNKHGREKQVAAKAEAAKAEAAKAEAAKAEAAKTKAATQAAPAPVKQNATAPSPANTATPDAAEDSV